MTKPKKTAFVFVLILSLSIFLLIPVFAATQDPWGPNWYTPYSGSMKAASGYVEAKDLYWSSSSLSTFATLQAGTSWFLVTEYEFRPNSGHPIDYWQNPSTSDYFSNFPSAYYEFEGGTSDSDNDIAVCCGHVNGCYTSTAYYGRIYLNSQPGANFSSNTLQLESEYGIYILFDALPSNYELWQTSANFNTDYPWPEE